MLTLWSGCSKSGGGVKLHTDTDSVAYVIGLNVGANLLKMDSTLNAAAVCKGIADYFAGRRTRLDSLPAGLREGLKLLGSGGAVKLWVPAALAYGAEGDRTLGVGANETLYYEAELLDVQADAPAGGKSGGR